MAVSVAGLVIEVDGKRALVELHSIEAELRRVAATATKSAAAVGAAGATMAGGLGAASGAATAGAASAMKFASAARAAAAAAAAAGGGAGTMAAGTGAAARGAAAAGAASARAATQVSNLARATNTASGAFTRFAAASTGFRGLFTFLTGAGAFGIVAHQMISLADGAALTAARLKLVNDSFTTNMQIQKDLFKIAQDGRTEYESTANLFVRLAGSADKLGLSYVQLLTFTDSVNKAFLISGVTAKESSNALIQLGQVLSSNRFAGDELRSLFENFPGFVKALEIGSGKGRDELRKMAAQGELTGKKLIEWLGKARDYLVKASAEIPRTFSMAMTQLENDFQAFLLALNQKTLTTPKLVEFIDKIREKFRDEDFLNSMVRFFERIATAMSFVVENAEKLLKGMVALDAAAKGFRIGAATGHPGLGLAVGLGLGALGVLGVDTIFDNDVADEKTEKVKKLHEEITRLRNVTDTALHNPDIDSLAPKEDTISAFRRLADEGVQYLWDKLKEFYEWSEPKAGFIEKLWNFQPFGKDDPFGDMAGDLVDRVDIWAGTADDVTKLKVQIRDLEDLIANSDNIGSEAFSTTADGVALWIEQLEEAKRQLVALTNPMIEMKQRAQDTLELRMEKQHSLDKLRLSPFISVGGTTNRDPKANGGDDSSEANKEAQRARERAADKIADLMAELEWERKLTDARQDSSAAMEAMNEQLESDRVIQQLGIDTTSDQAREIRELIYEIQQEKKAREELDVALEAQIEIRQILNDMHEEAKQITEEMRTPQEKYNEELKHLNDLLKVTPDFYDTYIKKVRALKRELLDADPVFSDVKDGAQDMGKAMADAFFGMASGAMTFKEAIADLGTKILDLLYDLLIVQPLMRSIEEFMYTMGGAGSGPGGSYGGSGNGIMDWVGSGLSLAGMFMGLGGGGSGLTGTDTTGAGGAGFSFTHFGGPRAGGGKVMKGGAYLVGEQGPELIVPSASGTVVSTAETMDIFDSLLSGKREMGGPVDALQPYLVGEQGPELYVPHATPGRGIHGGGGGGRAIVNHFTIVTPDANSFRQSQGQVLQTATRAMTKSLKRDV